MIEEIGKSFSDGLSPDFRFGRWMGQRSDKTSRPDPKNGKPERTMNRIILVVAVVLSLSFAGVAQAKGGHGGGHKGGGHKGGKKGGKPPRKHASSHPKGKGKNHGKPHARNPGKANKNPGKGHAKNHGKNHPKANSKATAKSNAHNGPRHNGHNHPGRNHAGPRRNTTVNNTTVNRSWGGRGVRYGGGYYYPGRNYNHWTRSTFSTDYNTTIYWDPGLKLWYYWDEADQRYYPVSDKQ
jgi:hypothetical protein